MKTRVLLGLTAGILAFSTVHAQKEQQDSTHRRFFIGSTLFMLSNLFSDNNPPEFVQLNLGYRIDPKNAISVEFKTWKYAWQLGIPYGRSFEAPGEEYPGHIRDFGVALAYQRFWWKGVYTAIHAMNTLQRYADNDGKKIRNGYMLFLTYRLGYHLSFFRDRFFIEPSIAMTHWPIKTNTPADFSAKEGNWPRVFFPEPGLHFGIKF